MPAPVAFSACATETSPGSYQGFLFFVKKDGTIWYQKSQPGKDVQGKFYDKPVAVEIGGEKLKVYQGFGSSISVVVYQKTKMRLYYVAPGPDVDESPTLTEACSDDGGKTWIRGNLASANPGFVTTHTAVEAVVIPGDVEQLKVYYIKQGFPNVVSEMYMPTDAGNSMNWNPCFVNDETSKVDIYTQT